MLLSNQTQLKNAIVELSPENPLYPKEWLSLKTPPTCFALGNTALLKGRKFGIVGSRRTPVNALKLGEKIAEELSLEFVIVTGTADGGDTAAIEGGLKSGKIICVLAGGFSQIPQGNLPLLERVAKEGLLISPHPFETEVRAFSYGYRNQLLATLCEGVLLLGAGEKSGALMTVEYAKAQGKKVFALPYPPNAASGVGCNATIKQGGFLVESAEDIATQFDIDLTKAKPQISLSADEEKIYTALQDMTEGHINEISEKSSVPPFKARAILSSLEIKGLAVSLGGNRYSVV